MSSKLPEHQEFTTIAFEDLAHLSENLLAESKDFRPTVLGVLYNADGTLLTTDTMNRHGEAKRVLMPESDIWRPYKFEKIQEAMYRRFGITSPAKVLGKHILKASLSFHGLKKPRLFVPAAFNVPKIEEPLFGKEAGGRIEWRTPISAIETLDEDEKIHGMNGRQRRGIVKFAIQQFLEQK